MELANTQTQDPGYMCDFERRKAEANPWGVTETHSGEKLTPQESAFVFFYINLGNAVEAYRRAGFTYPRKRLLPSEKALLDENTDVDIAIQSELDLARRKKRSGRDKKKEENILNKEYTSIPQYIKTLEKEKKLIVETDEEYNICLVACAHHLLRVPRIREEFNFRLKSVQDALKADSDEVLRYLTAVMRGQVKDQFGLDAPLSERTRAAECLAKRLIDIPNRINASASDSGVTLVIEDRNDDAIDGDYREVE